MLLSVGYQLEESTAATFLPISVADCKARLRIEDDDEDDVISSYIAEGATVLQEQLSRQFAQATYILRLDEFTSPMILPRPPVSSVSSIAYLDTAGDSQTLSTAVYRTVLTGPVPYIELAYNQTWPTTRGISRQVAVTFVCGYADGSVPDQIKNLVCMYVKQQIHGMCNEEDLERMKQPLEWRVV